MNVINEGKSAASFCHQVSISPIFFDQLFRTKVFLRSFYVLTIWVCNFLAKGFWHKRCSLKCWLNCYQVASWIPNLFCIFNLVKNHKIAKNLTTTKAREKNMHRFIILGFLGFMYVWQNNQILLNKIRQRILLTAKRYTGWKILITKKMGALANRGVIAS